MRTRLPNNSDRKHSSFVAVLLCLFQTVFCMQAYSQTAVVKGIVSASRTPVRYASVTFEATNDTTTKFSALTDSSGSYQLDIILTSVGPSTNLPTKFELQQNFPNPFSSSTAIAYQIKKESDIQVTIYDILGRVVRKFHVGQQSIGLHDVLWDGRNNFGQRVASGVYFYKLSSDGESQVKKMIFDANGNSLFQLQPSFSLSENSFLAKANKTQNVQGNTFTIRVENTSSTTPVIVSQEQNNVVIQNDTTINFSVEYIPTASVDFDSLHQIIRGFGATNLFFFGRPDMTDPEIETAFGTGDGQLGFTILRVGIDNDSTHWRLYVPTAKKAYDMGGTIIASPWYAPSNMVETVNGKSRVRHDLYGEYAAYLNSFVTYMKNNGVPIEGISIQNEPDNSGSWTTWTSDEMFTFMKGYADSIVATKVMDPESFHFDRTYSDPILNDSAACANTDIICGHIYGGGLASYPLAAKKGKEVWMTEYLINSGNPPTNTSIDTGWTGAIQTANSINDCMNADMNAYVWWYIVRYYGPIADGSLGGVGGSVTKKGYVMSQFARFIRPGFHRVESSVSPSISNVDVTAYKDPSSKVVIIAINSGSTKAETFFRIQNGSMKTTFTPYTTSGSKNCEQGVAFDVTGDNFSFTLDPSSITTFVSN